MDVSGPGVVCNRGRRRARFVDVSSNPRIPIFLDLVSALSRAHDPNEVIRVFVEAMQRAYGSRGYIALSTRGLPAGQYRIMRFLTWDGRELAPVAPLGEPDAAVPVHDSGLLSEIVRDASPKLAVDLDAGDDPVLGNALADCGSLIAVPLFDRGEPNVWAVVFERRGESYGVDELEHGIVRLNLVAATVHNVMIAKRLREASAWISREVDQIAAIQRALLPRSLPDIPGLSIAARYESFDRAGGDYYAFLPIDADAATGEPKRWAMLIADAAGHGPAATVVVAMLHAILRSCPRVPSGPAEILRHLDRVLAREQIGASFVTAFAAVYEPATRVLTYARAGHNPPLLKDPVVGGTVRRLDAVGGLPLGLDGELCFNAEDTTLVLEPGQTLVLYTDGIIESLGRDGTLFGIDGIERALVGCTGEPEAVVQAITETLRTHQRDRRPTDDQTIVAVRVNEER